MTLNKETIDKFDLEGSYLFNYKFCQTINFKITKERKN